MPCRQLIRGHPRLSPVEEGHLDIGISPFARSPSPFALFSNYRLKTVRSSNDNGSGNKARLTRSNKEIKKCAKLEQLEIFILPQNCKRGFFMSAYYGVGTDNNGRDGSLLMVATSASGPMKSEEPTKSSRINSSAAGSAQLLPLSLSQSYFSNANLEQVDFCLEEMEELEESKRNLIKSEENVSRFTPSVASSNLHNTTNTTTNHIDFDLLPIKKRRLRQLTQEQQHQPPDELLLASSSNCALSNSNSNSTSNIFPTTTTDSLTTNLNFANVGSSGTSNSTSTSMLTSQCRNNQQQSSTFNTATTIRNPTEIMSSSTPICSSSSTATIFLSGTLISNPTQHHQRHPDFDHPLPVPHNKPLKRRPVYIGNRKSVTFIDIESQRWWDRAHLAYAFHPKNQRKRKPSKKRSIHIQQQHVPQDIYDLEDPRSQSYQNWLTSFYPEVDYSSSGFIHSSTTTTATREDEPKNLLDKLGLANPLKFPNKDDDNHNDDDQLPQISRLSLGRFPPWVTEEGLKKFDITKLDSEYNSRSQKFHYD